jgi:arylsulfatase A-like enzyme
VIVTADVGLDSAAHVPFLEDETLDESSLAVPLVIRRPGPVAHARASAQTSSVDLARTLLDALALPPPQRMRGTSLLAIADAGPAALERPAIATTRARFSARWGGFVLAGARDREQKLCNLALEPECVSDVRATHPFAADILHRVVFDELASGKRPAVTAPRAEVAGDAGAPLRAWGR